jgi:hypothetical protein
LADARPLSSARSFEAGIGLTGPADIDAMQTVLENAGVEFIERGARLTT